MNNCFAVIKCFILRVVSQRGRSRATVSNRYTLFLSELKIPESKTCVYAITNKNTTNHHEEDTSTHHKPSINPPSFPTNPNSQIPLLQKNPSPKSIPSMATPPNPQNRALLAPHFPHRPNFPVETNFPISIHRPNRPPPNLPQTQ